MNAASSMMLGTPVQQGEASAGEPARSHLGEVNHGRQGEAPAIDGRDAGAAAPDHAHGRGGRAEVDAHGRAPRLPGPAPAAGGAGGSNKPRRQTGGGGRGRGRHGGGVRQHHSGGQGFD